MKWLPTGILIAAQCMTGCERLPPEEISRVSPEGSGQQTSNDIQRQKPAPSQALSVPIAEVESGVANQKRTCKRLRDESRQLAGRDPEAAKSRLRQVLIISPDDTEALFFLAMLTAGSNELDMAVDLLEQIPWDHPEAGLAALGQSADWLFQLERYNEAERRYLQVISAVPSAIRARRQLAYLLNRQGRRHEAAVHIRELCRQGNIRQDELHSLISLSTAMHDAPEDTSNAAANPNQRMYWPIGSSGIARHLFTEKRYREAGEQVRPMIAQGLAPPSVVALYGRAVCEGQHDTAIQWWLSQVDEDTQKHADYWAAIGTLELGQQRFETAIRALAEAIDRDPTDLRSVNRLRQALQTIGEVEQAKLWQDYSFAIKKSMKLNRELAAADPAESAKALQLAESLAELNRPLEATLWKWVATVGVLSDPATGAEGIAEHADTRQMLTRLRQQRERLVAAKRGFPSASVRLYGSNLLTYPLPENVFVATSSLENPAVCSHRIGQSAPAKFENLSAAIALDHTYQVAAEPTGNGFSIYQQLGGGVAVCDFDLDGACDLYFAQGAAEPPTYRGQLSNQLFRHVGHSLLDVTERADASETRYSLGVASGDWNQDGFPDLVSANLGVNTLLINNGDGTFTSRPLADTPNLQRLPSSIAMADVTDDSLPDLFCVYYVDDPQIAKKPPRDLSNRVLDQVSPGDFSHTADQLMINDGQGRVSPSVGMEQSAGLPGLGVLIANFDGMPGNEIFVGNDLYPNQLWGRDPERGKWSNVASLIGCAYGFDGTATGSMGIAAADFDNNGLFDIHIANFENESSSLFMHGNGMFQDRSVQYGLDSPTRPRVGFGCQAIDYDNDGWRDLVVTNGQLDDSIKNSGPFRQRCQLIRNEGGKFKQVEVKRNSGYWDQGHLGRGLAKLDWNRDGKTDFVVTHLGERSALLLNQTQSGHHWLQIHLVGTKSERDGTGALIRVQVGKCERVEMVTAGDGYLCRNESVVSFGLGAATQADVIVDWPSGETQAIGTVAADQRIQVIESQGFDSCRRDSGGNQ
ncbi:ASPIC and UnbV [Rubripirellula lacrimiformis]|uniref:ASPIC and UnbV n=1 Tax=Rubripirellula lacrimiformis TaxID=1930273 RepID=A0A517NHL4_9BACT|nr:FG-GAP-like repeat-containing protein [Rubripirellula lacrimiformis]QDT06635.1 ASPIC and UnbV [Rubripirellula lacrimiformis]